jgi:hypothetical protein
MKLFFASIASFALFWGLCAAKGQTTQPADAIDLGSGFKMRDTGGIDVAELYAEVVQFDSNWKETEEHDIFRPDIKATDDKTHVAAGDFTVPDGTFKLTETVGAIDNGIDFSAALSSDKEIHCNELSLAINLPVAAVGGKKIMVDDHAVDMPMEPAAKGQAHIFDTEGAKKIVIPTPSGSLTLTGNFTVLIQDDREWGDPRYGLRIQFTPGSGDIKSAKVQAQMTWTAAK